MSLIGVIDPHFPLGGIRGEFDLSSNGRRLTLTSPFQFTDDALGVLVPCGFVTDFNSVPRPLWTWFPPWECPEAAVIHDYLYQYPGDLSRGQVDAIHRRIMAIKGERRSKRVLAWMGIRVGGWRPWGAYRRAEAPETAA